MDKLTEHESKRINQSIIRAIKRGLPYIKSHRIYWEKGIGWYGQTTRVNFADDENFIEGLKEAKKEEIVND